MKWALKFILLILIIISFNTISYASKVSRIFIFTINGINTSIDEALLNSDRLRLESSYQSNMLSWDFLYNPTHGLLASDLWDVLRQKKQEGKELTIDDYVIAYMKTYRLNYPMGSREYEKLKEEIKIDYINDPSFVGKNLPEILDQFHEKIPAAEYADILSLLHDYKNTKNAYVLLIPHSQGNQYANQLWEILVKGEHFPTDHLAIFGIANPADKMNGTVPPILVDERDSPHQDRNIRYLTADNDYVIKALRVFSNFLPVTNTPMSSNGHLNECGDIICHNLIDSYLKDEITAVRIINQVELFISALKKKLIEDGLGQTIRILFMTSPADAKNMGLEMINSEGKIVCDTSGCDDKLWGYLYLRSKVRWDDYHYFAIGFADNLPAGEHTILMNLNGYSHQYASHSIRGNISSAFEYSYNSLKCTDFHLNQTMFIENNSNSPFTGKPKAYLFSQVDKDCSKEIPELYQNGKLIVGKFTLF